MSYEPGSEEEAAAIAIMTGGILQVAGLISEVTFRSDFPDRSQRIIITMAALRRAVGIVLADHVGNEALFVRAVEQLCSTIKLDYASFTTANDETIRRWREGDYPDDDANGETSR